MYQFVFFPIALYFNHSYADTQVHSESQTMQYPVCYPVYQLKHAATGELCLPTPPILSHFPEPS